MSKTEVILNKPFEAESEYLYQKKIEELQQELVEAKNIIKDLLYEYEPNKKYQPDKAREFLTKYPKKEG